MMKDAQLWLAGLGLLVAAALLAGCAGAGAGQVATVANTATRSTSWSLSGADAQNTRDVSGPIRASNVATLGVAWTVPITDFGTYGAFSTTAVAADGVVYDEDLASNVQAVDLASGKVLWTHKYDSPDEGPNGVSVAGGVVFGATETSAFALDAATGKQRWIKKLTRNSHEGIDMAPGYHDGTVYVSTVPGNEKSFYTGGGAAVLWALNASTGAARWKFDEVPADLWSRAHESVNSGGGQWYSPTFDSNGDLYIGVANPAPFAGSPRYPWGSSRPGPDLYTDSIVKLNVRTGKPIWHYQLTPHDIYDWDLQDSPILSKAGGRELAIDGGKAGILVAVDAQTGKPIWKRSVGVHNGHDRDNLEAGAGEYSKLHTPETVEPGDLGGIESQLASNGKTVFAAVNNLPSTYSGQGLAYIKYSLPLSKGTGDLVAVDEASGRIKWDDKLPSSPYGAVTLTNDVVFTTTFDGTLYAFSAATGKQLWRTRLSAATNAPVAVFGDTVVTAGSYPSAAGQQALVIAYRLGAKGALPSSAGSSSSSPSATGSAP